MGLPVGQWTSWRPGHDAVACSVAAHSDEDAIAIRDALPGVVGDRRPTGPHDAIWRSHEAVVRSRECEAHSDENTVTIRDAEPVVIDGRCLAGPVDAVWRGHDAVARSRAAHSNEDTLAIRDAEPDVVGG